MRPVHILRLCCWFTCMDNSPEKPLLSAIVAVSGFTLALAFAFPPIASLVLVAHSSLLPLGPLCLLSWLRHIPCHSSTHQLLGHNAPFQAIAHTSSCDVSLLLSESLCVVFASYAPTLPWSTGVGASSDTFSLMISNFYRISSKFLVPSETHV